jgi:hypothetical protein
MRKMLAKIISRNRLARGLIVAVLLGAIGSGIWELLIKPSIKFLVSVSVSGIASIFNGYLDMVYRTVSRNPFDTFDFVLSLFLICMCLPWVLMFSHWILLKDDLEDIESPDDQDESEECAKDNLISEIKGMQRSVTHKMIPVLIIATVLLWLPISVSIYSRSAAIFLERSIEIVAPYISEQERLGLRARFRSIETASDFFQLEESLRLLADKHSAELPEFEAIR